MFAQWLGIFFVGPVHLEGFDTPDAQFPQGTKDCVAGHVRVSKMMVWQCCRQNFQESPGCRVGEGRGDEQCAALNIGGNGLAEGRLRILDAQDLSGVRRDADRPLQIR